MLTGANIWQVTIDIAVLGTLLVIGQYIRAKVKIFQTLLIPPAVIAGLIALFLGPKSPWPACQILPLSNAFGTYASILILVVYGATAIGDRPRKEYLAPHKIVGMFFNLTGLAVFQYTVGMLFTILILKKFYPTLHDAFGLMMGTGFWGGHGTAAVVGKQLADLGVADMIDLSNSCATIGIILGIITGVGLINWGTRHGYTHYVESPNDLPHELRTGLIPVEKQTPAAMATVSNISVDPLAFHLGLVMFTAWAGYYLAAWFGNFTKAVFNYKISIPQFCVAMIIGLIVNRILIKTGGLKYVDKAFTQRIAGTATDFLMMSGIGSINLHVVRGYAIPLLLTSILAIAINFLWFFYIGGKASDEDWFERNMTVYGHATGVTATGVLLQRIVDPDLKSRGIEDVAITDILNRPIIISYMVIPPIVICALGSKGSWYVIIAGIVILIVMWIIAILTKGWVASRPLKKYR